MKANVLRMAIAAALDEGAPTMPDGTPLTRYEDLFAQGGPGPALGLCFDEGTLSIIAKPLAEAFKSPFFVPFDFDAYCPEGCDAELEARDMMSAMALMLRARQLPTIDDALARRAELA